MTSNRHSNQPSSELAFGMDGMQSEKSLGNILVVDDDRMNSDLLSNSLRKGGYQIQQAADGKEAIEAISGNSFDLVLLDIYMPGMNGYEVLTEIRKNHSEAKLPVIAVTAAKKPEQLIKALELGANDFITKPIDFDMAFLRVTTQMKLRNALAALLESEERYALAAQGTNDGLWDWQLDTEKVYYSPRWKAMLGIDDSTSINSPNDWLDRIHAEDRARVELELESHLDDERPHFEAELRMLHADGNYRWMICRGLAVRDKNDIATRIAGSLTDITEGKVADALTGLPNRLLFLDRLHRIVERNKRQQQADFAVLYLDLDNFKLINDSLGHEAGDQLLIDVSRRLETCVRACESIVARLGGDEFSILLERVDSYETVDKIAQRIVEAFNGPFNLACGHEVFTTVSVGISHVTDPSKKESDLLREADTAMYQAKLKGKSQHQFYNPKMHEEMNSRLEIEGDLRKAIARNEFVLHYQPIVELQGGKLVGFEALVRWNHPRLGLLAPKAFIKIAEETGLIDSLGKQVIQNACHQMAEWKRRYQVAGPLSLRVNVSSKQLTERTDVDFIEQTLRLEGLAPTDLWLEITESAVMDNPEQAAKLLKHLRKSGVKVGLDDFGTGYSSLSVLHSLPLDELKIDKSFVSEMLQSNEKNVIVKTLFSLADCLNLSLIAEGIETVEQQRHLVENGCLYGQGFLFSKPLPCLDIEELFKDSRNRQAITLSRNPSDKDRVGELPMDQILPLCSIENGVTNSHQFD